MDNFEMRAATPRGGATTHTVLPIHQPSPAAPIHELGGDVEGGGDHGCSDAHSRRVAPATLSDAEGLVPSAPHSEIADLRAGEGEVGQSGGDHQRATVDLAAPIAEIREQWRRRQSWHRAEKSLTLQAKALCRRLAEGGDKAEAELIYKAALGNGEHPMADVALAAFFPLTEARDGIVRHRKAVEKRLVKLAGQLPVAPWVEGTRGVGLLSLAAIVGEAGDLSGYANPAKLWKRMGLAVMPDGRQRRTSGVAALEHGYSPARRSVVWNIGACIVKAGGPLKAVYDARKVYESERVETKAHAHNRAQRYVEKRFLRELWSAWTKGRPCLCEVRVEPLDLGPEDLTVIAITADVSIDLLVAGELFDSVTHRFMKPAVEPRCRPRGPLLGIQTREQCHRLGHIIDTHA